MNFKKEKYSKEMKELIYKIKPINCIVRDQSRHVSPNQDDNFTDFTTDVKDIIYENVIMELIDLGRNEISGYKLSI